MQTLNACSVAADSQDLDHELPVPTGIATVRSFPSHRGDQPRIGTTREGGPVNDDLASTRHARHRHDVRARRYVVANHLVDAVRPSPAREEAHDPASWFPLVAFVDRDLQHKLDDHGGSVRPKPARPSLVVRHSPAREVAHDPHSWFPVSVFEELLAPENLVPENLVPEHGGSTRPAPAAPIEVMAVVDNPAPAPARVPEAPRTRPEIQRERRARRLRRRVRLAVAGVGLGAGLLLARAHMSDAPSQVSAKDASIAGAGAASGSSAGDPAPTAEPIEAAGFGAIPVSDVIPPPLPNEAVWDRMAQCETGGNWEHSGPTWSGGLGIYRGTWREAGGTDFAPLPRDASREEQIIVAERIRARHGWTAWGCARAIGVG
jgi:hypothetical protein